ncbi:MAG: phosphotransferase [Ornithinimicrobium sp.]
MRRSDLALAGIACAAVPGMKPTSVREVSRQPVDGPATHQTAIVEDSTGRTWVIRAPLSAVAGAELERNESLVSQLGKHLPFKAPAAVGYASLGPEQPRAAVYPYVDGSALNLHGVPAGPGLASAIGRAIAAIHNIPRDVFDEHDVPVFDAAAHRERQISELDRAAATGMVPTGLLARWEHAFGAEALWKFSATPVHGSLDGGAFLVAFADDDASSARVLALTHWDQACVTDPAQDFAAMVDQLTPAAFESVLESYSLARSSRPDPHLRQRARLAAEMRLISGLAQAVATNADVLVQNRIDELRKLDRLTTADSSLVPVPPSTETAPDPAGQSAAATTATSALATDPGGEDDWANEVDEVGEASGDESAFVESTHNEPTGDELGTSGPTDERLLDDGSAHIDADEDDDEQPVEVEHTSDSEFVAVHPPADDLSHPADTDVSVPTMGVSAAGDGWDGEIEGDDDVPVIDLDDEDATEALPRVRLGEDLEESRRLHDLYDMPDEELDDPSASDEGEAEAPGGFDGQTASR